MEIRDERDFLLPHPIHLCPSTHTSITGRSYTLCIHTPPPHAGSCTDTHTYKDPTSQQSTYIYKHGNAGSCTNTHIHPESQQTTHTHLQKKRRVSSKTVLMSILKVFWLVSNIRTKLSFTAYNFDIICTSICKCACIKLHLYSYTICILLI